MKTPFGAYFHRCALQVNPHFYAGQFRGQNLVGDEAVHAQAMVDQARKLDISVLGVTDHGSAGAVDHFRTAAQGSEVTVFPGFELTSSEGIHILCLYEPDTDARILERFMGEAGALDIMGIEYHRMQILTVDDILEGKRFHTPTVAGRHEPQPRLPGA